LSFLDFWSLLIQLHQLCQIEFWFLKQFYFSEKYILNREDLSAFFLDLFTNRFLHKLLGQLLECRFLGFIQHDLHHLSANQFLLRAFSIASSFHLFACSPSEGNGKHSEKVSIKSFSLHKCFNQSVPFLDKCAQFVSGNIHSVEVCVAIIAFYLLNLELHLSPGLIATFVLQIAQRYFKYSASETISCNLLTSCLVAGSKSWNSDIEYCGYVNIVPFFPCK